MLICPEGSLVMESKGHKLLATSVEVMESWEREWLGWHGMEERECIHYQSQKPRESIIALHS